VSGCFPIATTQPLGKHHSSVHPPAIPGLIGFSPKLIGLSPAPHEPRLRGEAVMKRKCCQ